MEITSFNKVPYASNFVHENETLHEFLIWAELILCLCMYCAVYECLCTKVWNCRKILAYCAQFDDILSSTHAHHCSWILCIEKALSSIYHDASSTSPHALIQRVLPKTIPTNICWILCRGTFQITKATITWMLNSLFELIYLNLSIDTSSCEIVFSSRILYENNWLYTIFCYKNGLYNKYICYKRLIKLFIQNDINEKETIIWRNIVFVICFHSVGFSFDSSLCFRVW